MFLGKILLSQCSFQLFTLSTKEKNLFKNLFKNHSTIFFKALLHCNHVRYQIALTDTLGNVQLCASYWSYPVSWGNVMPDKCKFRICMQKNDIFKHFGFLIQKGKTSVFRWQVNTLFCFTTHPRFKFASREIPNDWMVKV